MKLLIIDELGYVPLSQTGAELLFEVFCQRYERGATIITSNLPFEEWTSVFGSERLTGALLDRLTHHVHILEMNGESYRYKQARGRRRKAVKNCRRAARRHDRSRHRRDCRIIAATLAPPSSRREKHEGPLEGPFLLHLAAASGSLLLRRLGSRSQRR